MKYCSKFLASSICQNTFIAYIKKSINEELFKVEYLNKFSQYVGNLAKAVMRSHNKKLLNKAFKIFGGDNKIFNF